MVSQQRKQEINNMKRWQIKNHVEKNLKIIQGENLHGFSNQVPTGYNRGLEILGSRLNEAILRSCRVYLDIMATCQT